MPRIKHLHTFTFPREYGRDVRGECRCGAVISYRGRRLRPPRIRLLGRGKVLA